MNETGNSDATTDDPGVLYDASGEPDDPDQLEPAEVAPEESDEEKPWWDDPSLPWRHKPTRADLVCWTLIAAVAVYSFAILPLRAVLIGWNPPAAAMITGGRASVVATGAWARIYGGPYVVYWLVASVSLVKFSWVYWWAGHLWGTNIVDLLSGRSARAKRRAERAVRVANRFSTLAIILTFLPLPFPAPIVYAALGAAGMTLRRFWPPVLATSVVIQAVYFAIGWWIGQPAVDLVSLYAQYMLYVSGGIVVVMLAGWWWRRRQATGGTADEDD